MSASCYDQSPCDHEGWECHGGWHECNDCGRGLGTREVKIEAHPAEHCTLCGSFTMRKTVDPDMRYAARIVGVGQLSVSAEAADKTLDFDRPFLILVPKGHRLEIGDNVLVNEHGEYVDGPYDRSGSTLPNPMSVDSFITKDSGKREHFSSGMQRDTQDGKARWDLLFPLDVPYDAQFLTRVAELLARGAEKYDARNWEQAAGDEELERFKASAFRHLMQWVAGDTDEDHAAAVVFNLLGYETTKWKLDNGSRD